MQLSVFSSLALFFGVSLGSVIPAKDINHAEIYAANVTSPENGEISAQRNGNFVIVNQCYYDVYVWEAWNNYQSNMFVIKARSPFRKEFVTSYAGCTNNCGVVYKVTKTPNIAGGQGGNQVQFEYSSRDGILYYDISFVDCAKNLGYRTGDASNCPAWDQGIRIDGQAGFGCRTMECRARDMCIGDGTGAYYIDQPAIKWGLGEPVGTCPTLSMEVYNRLCASNPDL